MTSISDGKQNRSGESTSQAVATWDLFFLTGHVSAVPATGTQCSAESSRKRAIEFHSPMDKKLMIWHEQVKIMMWESKQWTVALDELQKKAFNFFLGLAVQTVNR